jgi:LysR family nitrogen assimilation transcriptional regulator
MPVSVFKGTPRNPQQAQIVMSEISGAQLHRMLVLATRAEPQPRPALALVQEFVVAEFSRLERQGVFSFGSGDVGAEAAGLEISRPQ